MVPSNKNLFMFCSIIIVLLMGICDYYMYKNAIIPLWAEIVYMIVFAYFTKILLKELKTNAEIRKLARAFFHENYRNKKLTQCYQNFADQKYLTEFLCYEPDILNVIRKYKVNNN